MRWALLLSAAALAGCGDSQGRDPEQVANRALLKTIPIYPPGECDVRDGESVFAARDCPIRVLIEPSRVIGFYRAYFQSRGWSIDGLSGKSLSAVNGSKSVDVGIRGDTVEVIARAQ
jgi:hypothetical protein